MDMVRTVTMVRTDVTPSVTRAGDCVLGRRKVSQESTTMSPLGPYKGESLDNCTGAVRRMRPSSQSSCL